MHTQQNIFAAVLWFEIHVFLQYTAGLCSCSKSLDIPRDVICQLRSWLSDQMLVVLKDCGTNM